MSEQTKVEFGTAFLLTATLLLLSFGQILFKWSSKYVLLDDPRTFLSPSLVAGLIVYGLATIMWILVLKRLPLSIAFPFYGLTFLLVPLLAHFMLGDRLSGQTLLGSCIIIIGIVVVNWGRLA